MVDILELVKEGEERAKRQKEEARKIIFRNVGNVRVENKDVFAFVDATYNVANDINTKGEIYSHWAIYPLSSDHQELIDFAEKSKETLEQLARYIEAPFITSFIHARLEEKNITPEQAQSVLDVIESAITDYANIVFYNAKRQEAQMELLALQQKAFGVETKRGPGKGGRQKNPDGAQDTAPPPLTISFEVAAPVLSNTHTGHGVPPLVP